MNNPKVYVGTYGKYNNGSIAGGWISLAECESYNDFLSKCKQLHKDERDPEYMIQDTEDFPDGLSCMEWLSESEFNDVKAALKEDDETPQIRIVDYSEKCFAVVGDTFPVRTQLKALGAWKFNKFLSCGAGWLFSKDKRQAVEAFINGAEIPKVEKESKNNKFTDWLKEFIKTQCKTDSDVKYYSKQYVGAIKLDDNYYLIEKPSISNRFCFHDEGPQYDFYKKLTSDDSLMRKYFIKENEGEFTDTLDRINKGERVGIENSEYMNQCHVYVGNNCYGRDYGREATEEEKALIKEGLNFGLKMFGKRLETYLNRYGTSKIHTWTYWADR